MVTDGVDDAIQKENYYVARVNHNFNNSRSSLGVALIGKTR